MFRMFVSHVEYQNFVLISMKFDVTSTKVSFQLSILMSNALLSVIQVCLLGFRIQFTFLTY